MKIRREDILRLSIPERIQLVEDIWDSIAEDARELPLTDAQRADLERRLDDHAKNPSDTLTWNEVREGLEREE